MLILHVTWGQPSGDQAAVVQLSKSYSVNGAPFETAHFHMAAPA